MFDQHSTKRHDATGRAGEYQKKENCRGGADNVQMVKDMYAAFGRGDMDAFLRNIAEDIEWVIAGPADSPTAGTFKGKAGVKRFVAALGADVDFAVFEPHEFMAGGNKVAVLVRCDATNKRSNHRVTDPLVHSASFKSGKIIRFASDTWI